MTSQTPEERPNIEETNDFPELEKQYVAMRDKGEFEWNHHDGDELGKKPISPWRIWTTFIKPTLHQQLQKSRQDWLREEIEKLKGMKTADYPSSLADPVGFSKCLGKNNTLQTIIDRYQFELDQDKK